VSGARSSGTLTFVIINPVSGPARRGTAGERVRLATDALDSVGLRAEILLTESAGHAYELARHAVGAGAELVIAWGGDGTINEVASEIAFRDVSFAVIPSGSGNGLARELKIPCNVEQAFAVALASTERIIDAGEIEGRLFFNVAGVGLDAQVAHEFAVNGLERRGFARYVEIASRRLFSFSAGEYHIVADGAAWQTKALTIALANGRQYGNGAIIAPEARVDDGRLDVIVVGERSALRALAQMPKLFSGRIGHVSGITMTPAHEVSISSATPIIYHVDGEPCVGGSTVRARIRPRALRVRVPGSG
jgi:YegS/Rv2252/BmrU family lipid kinase